MSPSWASSPPRCPSLHSLLESFLAGRSQSKFTEQGHYSPGLSVRPRRRHVSPRLRAHAKCSFCRPGRWSKARPQEDHIPGFLNNPHLHRTCCILEPLGHVLDCVNHGRPRSTLIDRDLPWAERSCSHEHQPGGCNRPSRIILRDPADGSSHVQDNRKLSGSMDKVECSQSCRIQIGLGTKALADRHDRPN